MSIYPEIWFVAHSGFIRSGPHTEKRAKVIVEHEAANDGSPEWEAVKYIPVEQP